MICILFEENVGALLMVLKSTKKCKKSRKITLQATNNVEKKGCGRLKVPLSLEEGKRN
jgi:hypothetical protein